MLLLGHRRPEIETGAFCTGQKALLCCGKADSRKLTVSYICPLFEGRKLGGEHVVLAVVSDTAPSWAAARLAKDRAAFRSAVPSSS